MLSNAANVYGSEIITRDTDYISIYVELYFIRAPNESHKSNVGLSNLKILWEPKS